MYTRGSNKFLHNKKIKNIFIWLIFLSLYFCNALVYAAPSVTLTTDAAIYQVGSGTPVTATAVPQVDSGRTVTKVEIFKNGALERSFTTSPYVTSSTYAAGSYTLYAKVTDSAGETAISTNVVVKVNSQPVVTFTSPANDTFFDLPANISIVAKPTDSDSTINRVEFYSGTTLIGTATASPWTVVWSNTTSGTYTISAKVFDSDGGTGVTFNNITIKTGSPPTVAITSPLNNALLNAPANFNITVNVATPNSGATISKVTYYKGSTVVYAAYSSPYSAQLTNVPAGTNVYKAVATDSLGATATSDPITVKINSAPTVNITSPSNNSLFSAPSNITITANASDADGTLTKVEFYNGSTLIGTATTAPWSVTWSNVAAGSYSITAKAFDNDSAAVTSSAVSTKVANNPAISITSPSSSSVFNAPATMAFTTNPTTPNPGATISKVELYRNNALIATTTASPWTLNVYNEPQGLYSYTAKVTDSYGATATSSAISVKVNGLPSVSISSPTTNSFFEAPASITLTAAASDADGTVSKVSFYNGTTLIATANSAPWSIQWGSVQAGTYTITAKATDNDGGEKTSSAITVKAGAFPTVGLSVNQAGTASAPPYSFNLVATPSTTNAGGSISSVKFYRNGTLIGQSSAAPWTLAWGNVSAGTYAISAVVTDNNNSSTTSPVINVLVGDFPPVIFQDGQSPNQPSTSTRTSAFEYDPSSGLLTKEITQPDSPEQCVVTIYTYDNFGNKVSSLTRNCNGSAGSHSGINSEAAAPATNSLAVFEPRSSSQTYDSLGRFVVSSKNALNQTETKVYDTRFGQITSLTGPNQLTTTWTYDSFGRALVETRADFTGSTTAYSLCDASCPTNAKFFVQLTEVGRPKVKTYYDMLGRPIKKETEDKNASLIYQDTEYDHIGNVSKVSRPYFVGQTRYLTETTYDILGRPVQVSPPDGNIIKVSYRGKVVITTNALNQTKTEIHDSLDKTKQIIDAQGKSITYVYDAFGNLTQTKDAAGNITTISYDDRGRKTAMKDPDQGSLTYNYDALGNLKKQIDAKNQTVTFLYDKLGRMTQRNEPDLVSTWVYDVCDTTLNPSGKCVGKPVQESSDNGYVRTYLYDAYGRNTAELDNVDTGYGVSKSFDQYGRVETLVYPTGFTVKNTYSSTGYLIEVSNATTQASYWRLDSMDAAGNVTQETYGNGVVTNRTYNNSSGMLSQIAVGTGSSPGGISNQTFVYDTIGNLTQRYEAATGLNESFGFDSLNRLTGTTAISGSTTTSVTVQYDAIGNITYKSDLGTYTYGAVVNGVLTKPHAVTKIVKSDGTSLPFSYDANGNSTNFNGRTLVWKSWNMPTSITSGTKVYSFVYNSAHERVKEVTPVYTIYNVSPRLDTGIHVEKRIKTSDGSIEYVHSLYAGTMPFGTVTTTVSSTVIRTRYLHTDHLGSIVAITNEAGALVERRSYDAWGKRRNLDGTAMGTIPSSAERHGFTGHEELEDIFLIHMNGRLYNTSTGRFLSADPTIQYADDMQSFNRYSYINNNPLSAVDYSGYGFLSKVWREIKRANKNVFEFSRKISGQRIIDNYIMKHSWARAVGQIAAAYFGPGAAAAYSAYYTYLETGSFNAAIKSAAITWTTAQAFNGVHGMDPGLGKILAHGMIGGVSSLAQGGDFKSGFLSAGFTQSLSGSIGDIDRVHTGVNLYRTVAASIVGGTASVIGGGKFANGAVTGAFSRMFNDDYEAKKSRTLKQYFEDVKARYDSTNDAIEKGMENIAGPLATPERAAALMGGGAAAKSYGGSTFGQEASKIFNEYKNTSFSLFRTTASPDVVRVGATGIITTIAVNVSWKAGIFIGSAIYEAIPNGD